MEMIKEKILQKKRCKACGNTVIVKVNKYGQTPAPISCATCRSLGVVKAIEQRLSVRAKGKNTKVEINSKKELDDLKRHRKQFKGI